jgi:hypothetical protein
MPPPPRTNNTTQNNVPPRQPQQQAQPALNPNTKQVQPVYNSETTYQTYSLEVQEINLRSRKVLQQQQPKLIKYVEYEKEEITSPQKKTYTSEEKELLGEIKSLCIKIPLLQAIKDVPIFNRFIKEKCIRRPWRKRKDAPTINVIGQLVDLMLGKLIVPKYLDPGSPLVNVHINKTLFQNPLIDPGVGSNVMTKDTMLKSNIRGSLRDTPIVL